MKVVVAINSKRENLKALIFNVSVILCVYLIPTLSHSVGIPIYLFEPMRIMIILALAHTRRENAFLLAATLPIISFLISGHPVFPKMLVISLELITNIWLFMIFMKYIKIRFFSMFFSIVMSKLLYYLILFILIQLSIYAKPLHSTPFLHQLIVSIILSIYTAFFVRFPKKEG